MVGVWLQPSKLQEEKAPCSEQATSLTYSTWEHHRWALLFTCPRHIYIYIFFTKAIKATHTHYMKRWLGLSPKVHLFVLVGLGAVFSSVTITFKTSIRLQNYSSSTSLHVKTSLKMSFSSVRSVWWFIFELCICCFRSEKNAVYM